MNVSFSDLTVQRLKAMTQHGKLLQAPEDNSKTRRNQLNCERIVVFNGVSKGHFEDNSSFYSLFLIYDEIHRCTSHCSCLSICCISISMCSMKRMLWLTISRIQCHNSTSWDDPSVFPISLDSNKFFCHGDSRHVCKSSKLSCRSSQRFWHLVNPSKRGEGKWKSKSRPWARSPWFLYETISFSPLSHWEKLYFFTFPLWKENLFHWCLHYTLHMQFSHSLSSISSWICISINFHDSQSRNDSWLHEKFLFSSHSFLLLWIRKRQNQIYFTRWCLMQSLNESKIHQLLKYDMNQLIQNLKDMLLIEFKWYHEIQSRFELIEINQFGLKKSNRIRESERSSLQLTREKSLNPSREWMLRRRLKQLESLEQHQHQQREKQQRNNHCTRPFRESSRDGLMESLFFYIIICLIFWHTNKKGKYEEYLYL